MLRTLAAASGASLFRRAHLFVLAHDVWKTRVCRNEHGKPTGACCSDCRRGDRYQLPRYAGGRGGGASQAHGACSYFAEGWCPREEGGEWDVRRPPPRHLPPPPLHTHATRPLCAAAQLLASDNAALLADGAFNHRPTVDAPARMEAAGFAPGGARYVIHGSRGPAFELVDHNGWAAAQRNTLPLGHAVHDAAPAPHASRRDRSGQQSWVDVARCCAMAPANSTEPGRDLPDTRAFAGPPLDQCLTEAQLRRLRASGRNVSPCRAQNAAFFRADDGQWRARHPACCAYLREFLRRAPSEFTDNRSQRLLAVVARQPTLFVQARKLVALFNRFTREVCRADATPSGRCCADCLTAHRNKKTAFADPTSCGGHGGRGAPRRAYCTPAQLAAANRSAHAQRAAHAATASHVAATTAASGFDRGGSGDVGGGGLTAERAQAQVTPGADSPSPQLNSLTQALRQWQGSRREPDPAFVASLAAALRQLAAEAPQGRSQPPPSAAAGSLDAVSEAESLVHGMVGTAGGAGGAGSSNVDPAGMPPRRQQQRQQALEPQRVPSPPPSQPESERGIPAWAEGLGPDERQRLEALRAEQDLIAQELTDISRHHADRKARGGG